MVSIFAHSLIQGGVCLIKKMSAKILFCDKYCRIWLNQMVVVNSLCWQDVKKCFCFTHDGVHCHVHIMTIETKVYPYCMINTISELKCKSGFNYERKHLLRLWIYRGDHILLIISVKWLGKINKAKPFLQSFEIINFYWHKTLGLWTTSGRNL